VGAGVYAGNVMATAGCETAGVWRGQYGNGGTRATGVWRLLMDQVDLMDLMDNVGAPRDNPRVCGALGGLARVGICRWVARAV